MMCGGRRMHQIGHPNEAQGQECAPPWCPICIVRTQVQRSWWGKTNHLIVQVVLANEEMKTLVLGEGCVPRAPPSLETGKGWSQSPIRTAVQWENPLVEDATGTGHLVVDAQIWKHVVQSDQMLRTEPQLQSEIGRCVDKRNQCHATQMKTTTSVPQLPTKAPMQKQKKWPGPRGKNSIGARAKAPFSMARLALACDRSIHWKENVKMFTCQTVHMTSDDEKNF